MTGKYKAFISYSHGDTQWGEWLQRSLEGYKVPKPYVGLKNDAEESIELKLGKIFRDRDELKSSSDLGGAIHAALEASENLIVICSPMAGRSDYVDREIIEFKRLGRDNRIYCLIVEGEPNASRLPGKEDLECLPKALRFALDAQGNISDRLTLEVLAADARSGKDGKNRALIKLIAALLHVDFDALYQRERRRQRQRLLIALTTTVTVVALLIAGLTAWQSMVDLRSIHALATSAIHSRALLCREGETLKVKESGLKIAAETGNSQFVEAFSKQVEDIKLNMEQFSREYIAAIHELSKFKRVTVHQVLNEPDLGTEFRKGEEEQSIKFARATLWQLLSDDYIQYIDIGGSPIKEPMDRCPM